MINGNESNEKIYDNTKELGKNFIPTKESDFDILGNFLAEPCKQLFRKNILTCWSGLMQDAHIGFEYEQLSSENKEIINELISQKDSPWKFITLSHWELEPPYDKIVWLAFPYKDNETPIQELKNQFSRQISLLKPQDLVIINKKSSRAGANCVRFSRKGIVDYFCKTKILAACVTHNSKYLQKDSDSEIPVYNVVGISQDPEGEISWESFEHSLNESRAFKEFINSPKFYYDKTSDTFFRSYDLLKNSLKFRGLETPVQIAVKYYLNEMENATRQTNDTIVR